jgi:outer membrane protein assembly factor BamE (lipoprotein component of BamABCDE complex)
MSLYQKSFKATLFALVAIFALANWCADAKAQKARASAAPVQARAVITDEPLYSEYKGIRIGMTASEVRKKLGEPTQKSDEQDFYVFNEKELAQIFYDNAQKVKAISVDFMGGTGAPGYREVIGAQIETKPDGSMYKIVRYPKAGYWVSYNRTAGEAATVTVTIQTIK